MTHTTLTDIGHAGRVFIGAILSTRYKRSRRVLDRSRMPGLLKGDAIDRAVLLGLAFRLGVALTSATPGILCGCKTVRTQGKLELSLQGQASELAGEEVEKRLRHLADELEVDGVVRAIQA